MSETRWLLVLLLVIGSITHFMWLSFPRDVVFDEVHFGKFVTAYCCTHERFFDIHPPHAKLLIAGAAYMTGYRGGLSFENIGQSYGAASPFGFRLVPALSGVALPLVFFGLLRGLGASRAAAFFGGLLLVFDNALTVQTRIIALDGLMLLAMLSSVLVFLPVVSKLSSRDRLSGRDVVLSLLAGGLAGLAVGVKFTGLVAGGLLVVILVGRMLRVRSWREIWRYLRVGVLLVIGAVLIYLLGWAAHFALLNQPGPGDAWRIPAWERPLVSSFIRETVAIHRTMFLANYDLSAGHFDSSKWWSWPLMQKPVFYWNYSPPGGGDLRAGSVYFFGNPLVWWGSSLLFVAGLIFVGSSAHRGKSRWRAAYLIPLAGYLMAYVPLMRIPRALFLYHYLTPLIFSLLFGVLWLDQVGFFRRGSVRQQALHYYAVLGLVVLFFIFFSPLTYGFLLDPDIHKLLFWFSDWR